MLINKLEETVAKSLSFGAFFTAIFLYSSGVTDPVNVTKLVSLGVTAGIVFGLILTSRPKYQSKTDLILPIVLLFFILFASISSVVSDSPFSQNFYGSYGRNNGLVMYIFLAILLFAASLLTLDRSFIYLIRGLIAAGIVNVIYCLWVILFGDFIGWSNPYGNILGTFGNPNFIGSFLGIFFSVTLAYAFRSASPRWSKIGAVPLLIVTAFEIYDSNAIQGRVVALLGSGIVVFFAVRSRFGSVTQLGYMTFASLVGVFGIAGALQRGPLEDYIYKTSVSLRGQYWLAGWNTGEAHPFFGVGMDSFGDWYRRSRDARAIELPGVNTVVNAAHNVPLDMFAFGGWTLFLSYIAIMVIGIIAIVKVIIRSKKYDPIFVALVVGWVGYQVQSIISINQIGLAIWGWVLTGAIIAYERTSSQSTLIESKQPQEYRKLGRVKSSDSGSAVVLAASTGLIGLLVALPPLVADGTWSKSMKTRTVESLVGTMESGYFNPQNSTKFLNNIQTLEGSQLFDLARDYALKATTWNPQAYELWKVLYLIKNSTPEEKALALKNMKRLDPLNPDVTATS